MNLNVHTVTQLVNREMAKIAQAELLDVIREYQIEPRCELRAWDYGEKKQRFPCWVVVEHKASNTCICYCENGFGPTHPWGLLFISGEHLSMGMDSGWFSTLEDAVRESAAWEGENPSGYEVG